METKQELALQIPNAEGKCRICMDKKKGTHYIPCKCKKPSLVHRECLWEKRKESRNPKKMFKCLKCKHVYDDTFFFVSLYHDKAYIEAGKKMTSIIAFVIMFTGTAFMGGYRMIDICYPKLGFFAKLTFAMLPLFVIHGFSYFLYLLVTRMATMYKILCVIPVVLIVATILEMLKTEYATIAAFPLFLFTGIGLIKFYNDTIKYVEKTRKMKAWKSLKIRYLTSSCQCP
jgi:hypothetical protein